MGHDDNVEPHELTFVIFAKDFDRTIEFYSRTLELRRIESWERADSQGARFAAGPNAVVEVFGAPGPGIDERTAVAGVSLGLSVDGVDAWHTRLRSEGVECTDPEDQWWGGRTFYCFDPNGLPVMISETKGT